MEGIVQRALDGDVTEEQAIEYIEKSCDDRSLVEEIVNRVATASVSRGIRTASGIVDWILSKCAGNKSLLAGVIALMLASGTLGAYEVKQGDTLWKLGGGTTKGMEQVLALNSGITESTVLNPGMKLVLPNEKPNASSTYKVQKGDTFYGVAKAHGMTVEQLKSLNPDVKDIDSLSIGQVLKVNGNRNAVQPKTDPKTDYVARVIYAESGNSVEEMEMIAHLIVNRMRSKTFPNSAYDVVRQKLQFSCTSGTDGNVKWKNYSRNLNKFTKKAYELAEKVMKKDSSGMKGDDSSLFYCTKSLAKNGVGKGADGLSKEYGHPKSWGEYSTFTPVDTSSKHVFYKCSR